MIECIFLNEGTGLRIPRTRLMQVVRAASREFPNAGKSSISIIVTNARTTRALNKQHRGKNYVPDVLTLEYAQKFKAQKNAQLGEMYITDSMLKKQAKMYQHSIADEFTILVVHGIVHMMGFEHEGVNEQEKLLMQKHEKNILSRVGLSPDF